MHGTALFTMIFGFIGQLAKSHPEVPNWIPNTVMLVLGLGWYAGNHGLPVPEAHTLQAIFAAWTDWTEAAFFAAAAIPGTASIFGMIPALKTRTNPNP